MNNLILNTSISYAVRGGTITTLGIKRRNKENRKEKKNYGYSANPFSEQLYNEPTNKPLTLVRRRV